MKTKFLILICSTALLASCDNNKPKPKASEEAAENRNDATIHNDNLQDDADFLVKVAEGGMWEVELGKMAEKKGTTSDVKSFGKMMAQDHSKLNDELRSLATNKNISVPGILNEDKQKKLDKFAEKTGRNFDDDYIDAMIDDHEKDIKVFEDKANDEKADADIRRWANETLPTLRHHLSEIKSVKERFDTAKR